LFGAGSTQGELLRQGLLGQRTLLKDLGIQVYELSKERKGEYEKLCNAFGMPPDQDIEIMISLFESGRRDNSNFAEIANEIKQLYRLVLINRISKNEVFPIITSSLLHIHKTYGQYMGEEGEELSGVLTLNNDSLIDAAFCHPEAYNGLNYIYPFSSSEYNANENAPPFLKLHGSFNWEISDTYTLTVSREFEKEPCEDFSGWIPPSVFKTPFEHPVFEEIWKKARELLDSCDVLRVVGCSLRKEDIQLLSLLFGSQVNSSISGRRPFQIELIIPEKSAQGGQYDPGVIQNVRFLSRLKSLSQLYVFQEGFDDKQRNVYNYWVDKLISWIEKKGARIAEDDFIITKFYGGDS